MNPLNLVKPSVPKPFKDVPPLLEGDDPFTPDDDGHDRKRVEWVHDLWHRQDILLRQRDRTVEEHIRMLCGQHWTVWSEVLGAFIDVTQYMSDEERRWRFLPVVNRVLHWFILQHARMTENPPVITWQPASGDRIDAELAEVADVIWKVLWNETGMLERVDELMSWLVPCGTAYAKTRIDPLGGEIIEWRGEGVVPVVGPEGSPVSGLERMMRDVPFGQDGNPLAQVGIDGQLQELGSAHTEYEGALKVDILSIFQARGEWGPTPWDDKRYHLERALLTPEQVWDQWGVEVDPTITGQEAEDTAEFQRMLLGSGFYGAGAGNPFLDTGYAEENVSFVEVIEAWHRPSRLPGMERTNTAPGGRLTIVAGDKRIRDGQRPAAFRYTSPIREFLYVNVPGRPNGTSPEEMLVGPNKTENRVTAQILQHTTLASNPKEIIDIASGIQPGQVTNKPGQRVEAYLDGYQGDPIRYAQPPQLSQDPWRTLDHIRLTFNDLGSVAGSEGRPPTKDASGELTKELRFNADRPVGPTLRRAVLTFGRMAEDWQAYIPLIWDRPKVLRVAGDDFVAQTINVYPHLFEQGHVNVVPEIESMLPEGRGERQARVERHYQEGLYGPPGTPEAIERYWQEARFPHMSREARPGGMSRVTAEQAAGKLMQGMSAREIPVFEWYDHGVFLSVIERVMQSPEYLKLSPEIMQEFVVFRELIIQAAQASAPRKAAFQAILQAGAVAGMASTGALDALNNPDAAAGVVPGIPDRGPTATPVPA